jgi:hypothetical protein
MRTAHTTAAALSPYNIPHTHKRGASPNYTILTSNGSLGQCGPAFLQHGRLNLDEALFERAAMARRGAVWMKAF